MSSRDPFAEWRARWATQPADTWVRPPRTGSRSPWVYALAAFGGTMAAIVGTLAVCIVGLFILLLNTDSFDSTPASLTYHNDTQEDVWVYECYGRCDDYAWGFRISPGDEESFRLTWYDNEEVEWVVIALKDYSYECIHIRTWEDQTLRISGAERCPSDIHSPEVNIAWLDTRGVSLTERNRS